MNAVLYRAEEHFRRALANCVRVPVLLRVGVRHDALERRFVFTAEFSEGPHLSWVEYEADVLDMPDVFHADYEGELKRLWSRLAEDRGVGRRLDVMHDTMLRMEHLGAPRHDIEALRCQIEREGEHARRHHHYGRSPAMDALDAFRYATAAPSAAANNAAVGGEAALTVETLRRVMQRLEEWSPPPASLSQSEVMRDFIAFGTSVLFDHAIDDVGSKKARAKGLALLKA